LNADGATLRVKVKVVFVNIFGGLTLGDMIADGIIMAFQDLGITVPVVVRIRGTNEEVGQQKVCKHYVVGRVWLRIKLTGKLTECVDCGERTAVVCLR
jgi:succinyl-CoA synthetase beta subunit